MKYRLAIDMCYFYNTHAGGKDEVAYNLLRGFDKLGVSKEIVCFCYKKLVPIIKKANPNVRICVVPKIRTGKFFHDFHFWFRSHYEEMWCKKNKVGLLLLPNKPTANRVYSVPTVVIPHDIEVFENNKLPGINFSQKYFDDLTARIKQDFKNRDYIIAISDFDNNEMIKFMPWAESKITRIYDPILFDDAYVSNEKEKKYITALNIQWLHKNVFTVIKAFNEIAESIPYNLILVGNPPDNIAELKKYIKNHDLVSRIEFTGFVSNERLIEIIEKTRIYVNASFFEGFGMTAIEMMGKGVPTIVANCTAMPEVTMGLCRYYSPTDDSTALAKVILEELSNPQSEEELKKISDSVKAKYSYEIIAREYWAFVLNKTGVK